MSMLKVAIWFADNADELAQVEVIEVCQMAGSEPVLKLFETLQKDYAMTLTKQIEWVHEYAKEKEQ